MGHTSPLSPKAKRSPP